MKKSLFKILIFIILTLSVIIFFLSFYILKEKKDDRKSNSITIKEEITSNYSNYYFMNNPIDEYFIKIFNKPNLCEIEVRDYQEDYLLIWENVYTDITKIIQEKCIYDEDIARFDQFIKEIDTSFDTIKPLLLAEMLDNYDMPESPEKHSYGNGTNEKLNMYKGMIYRNACMLFIPYLEDEYIFASANEIEAIIKKLKLED